MTEVMGRKHTETIEGSKIFYLQWGGVTWHKICENETVDMSAETILFVNFSHLWKIFNFTKSKDVLKTFWCLELLAFINKALNLLGHSFFFQINNFFLSPC